MQASRRVSGHAPLRIFSNLDIHRCNLVQSGGFKVTNFHILTLAWSLIRNTGMLVKKTFHVCEAKKYCEHKFVRQTNFFQVFRISPVTSCSS